MKLKLIATINNFTITDLYNSFPRLKVVVENFKRVPNRQKWDYYKGFKDSVSLIVGKDSDQDKYDSGRAYQMAIDEGWSETKPKPKSKKREIWNPPHWQDDKG